MFFLIPREGPNMILLGLGEFSEVMAGGFLMQGDPSIERKILIYNFQKILL